MKGYFTHLFLFSFPSSGISKAQGAQPPAENQLLCGGGSRWPPQRNQEDWEAHREL